MEINSSFHRHHQATTYARWAAVVPAGFRFAVKLAREFTHHARLAPDEATLAAVLGAVRELGEKLNVLLVQLPPSLPFDARTAARFFPRLREQLPARVDIALEPRHRTWADTEALALLEACGVSKVLADPEPVPPPLLSTDSQLRYYRLHGTPEMYRSRYRLPFLQRLAQDMASAPSRNAWCVFDNTTYGHALDNAHELRDLLRGLHGRDEARIVS